MHLERLCDGGHLLSRAKIDLHLEALVPDAQYVAGMQSLLRRELTGDLFERPPQRERIRVDAVRLVVKGLDQSTIASRLPEKAPVTAVQRALALDRRMQELGLATPYLIVREPPSDYPKLRRHKNPKYQFERLMDYQPPVL